MEANPNESLETDDGTRYTVAEYGSLERAAARFKRRLGMGGIALTGLGVSVIGAGNETQDFFGIGMVLAGSASQILAGAAASLQSRYETVVAMHENPDRLIRPE